MVLWGLLEVLGVEAEEVAEHNATRLFHQRCYQTRSQSFCRMG